MPTRGNVEPAKLKNLITDEEVSFMFNPFEFTFTKQNSWNEEPATGHNAPWLKFNNAGAQTVSLSLHFDSQADKKNVRTYTAPLWKMVTIDASNKNAKSGKGEPPPVQFTWGTISFTAVITQISEKFTLFDATGMPLRSTVDISLKEFHRKGTGAQSTQSGTGMIAAETTVTQGQRMDHVAASTTGSAANQRKVAEQNNINNPLNVPNGSKLKTSK